MDIQEIEKIVCSWKFIDPKELHDKSRKGVYAYCRQLIWYFLYQPGNEFMTVKDAGGYFCRDHSTVLSGINVINNYLDTDRKMRQEIEFLRKMVNKGISREDVLNFNDRLCEIENVLSLP